MGWIAEFAVDCDLGGGMGAEGMRLVTDAVPDL
jgi:hypothetical protein